MSISPSVIDLVFWFKKTPSDLTPTWVSGSPRFVVQAPGALVVCPVTSSGSIVMLVNLGWIGLTRLFSMVLFGFAFAHTVTSIVVMQKMVAKIM